MLAGVPGCSKDRLDARKTAERFHILAVSCSACRVLNCQDKVANAFGNLAAFDHSIGTFEPAVPKARSSTEQRLPDVECRRVSSLVVAWLSSVVEVMRIVSGLCLDCVS